MRQTATRVENNVYEVFKATSNSLGLSPADALRVFIYSFNEHHGFPFEVTSRAQFEPFETEDEALDFATAVSMEAINEAR